MKNKILAICIIGMFLLLSIPNILADENEASETDVECIIPPVDVLDQFQTQYSWSSRIGPIVGGPITGENSAMAQAFMPTKHVLTRIQLYLSRSENAVYPLIVGIKRNLNGKFLESISMSPEEFPAPGQLSWIEFDFDDMQVTPYETYYIVAYTANVTNNTYSWGVNNGYYKGHVRFSKDGGVTWESSIPISMATCFKTYGRRARVHIWIQGGIGKVQAYIRYDEPSSSLAEWEISVKGGLFGMVDVSKSGCCILENGDYLEISTDRNSIIRRFGKIEVEVTVELTKLGGSPIIITEKMLGWVFGRYVYMLPILFPQI